MDLLRSEHVSSDPLDNRRQQPCRLTDPVAQRGSVEIDPVASIDVALPVERQVIAVFRHQQMREHRRCGTTTRCRHRGRRCLGDRIARLAGVFGPDMPDHLEAARHIVQHLGHVLAELRHATTAVRADAGAISRRLMNDLLPQQVLGQRLALRRRTLAQRRRPMFRRRLDDILGLAGLQLFKLQGELLDLPGDPFRRTAKLHASQFGDLELQLLDLQCSQLNRKFGRLQLGLTGQRKRAQRLGIGGQVSHGERHKIALAGAAICRPSSTINRCLVRPALAAPATAMLPFCASPSPRSAAPIAPASASSRHQQSAAIRSGPSPTAWRTGTDRCRPRYSAFK